MKIRRKDLSRIIQEELRRSLREQKAAELKGGTKDYLKDLKASDVPISYCTAMYKRENGSNPEGKITLRVDVQKLSAYSRVVSVEIVDEEKKKMDFGEDFVECVKKRAKRLKFDKSVSGVFSPTIYLR